MPHSNFLLASLPVQDLQNLIRHGENVSRVGGEIIQDVAEDDYVFFPISGMASLSLPVSAQWADTAWFGRDGAIGLGALTNHRTLTRAICRIPMTAIRISSAVLRELAVRHVAIGEMHTIDQQRLLERTQRHAAACARLTVRQRFADLLIRSAEYSSDKVISLDQQTISEMLAVRRTSITEAAIKLQNEGAISYLRGKILITNASKLERAASSD